MVLTRKPCFQSIEGCFTVIFDLSLVRGNAGSRNIDQGPVGNFLGRAAVNNCKAKISFRKTSEQKRIQPAKETSLQTHFQVFLGIQCAPLEGRGSQNRMGQFVAFCVFF